MPHTQFVIDISHVTKMQLYHSQEKNHSYNAIKLQVFLIVSMGQMGNLYHSQG